MAILLDWVQQLVTGTPGTGTITLGAAVTNFIQIQEDSRISDGSIVHYMAIDGVNKERGIGTYTASGTTLARTKVVATMDAGVFDDTAPSPISLSSSTIITITAISETHNFKGCLLDATADQTVSNSTTTTVAWDDEVYDTDGFHDNSTNNSRLTIPIGVSKVIIKANLRWASDDTGKRIVDLNLNGAGVDGRFTSHRNAASQSSVSLASSVISVVAGDYFDISVYQTSGGNLDLELTSNSCWLALEVVE